MRRKQPPSLQLATFNGQRITGDYTPAPLKHDFSQNGTKKPLHIADGSLPYHAFIKPEDSIEATLHEDIPLTDEDFDFAEALENDWNNALAPQEEEKEEDDQDIALAHWISINTNKINASSDFQDSLKAILAAKRNFSDVDNHSVKNSKAISFLSYHSASIRRTLKSAVIPDDVILSTLIDQDTIDSGAPLPTEALELAQKSVDLIEDNCEGYTAQNEKPRIVTCIRLLEMTETFLHDYLAITESEPASYLLDPDDLPSEAEYMAAQQHITQICLDLVNDHKDLAAFFNIQSAQDMYADLGTVLIKDLNQRGYMYAAQPHHKEILIDTLLSYMQESAASAPPFENTCDNNIVDFPLITRTKKGENFASACMQNIPNDWAVESDLHDLTACLNKCMISFAKKTPARDSPARIYTLSPKSTSTEPEPSTP